ncbi:MAG TPA: hypothetical protein DCE41_20020 [Cytophagales bacterium]|nr:hypothetical protein [Cytophagales bacterium]HAA24077.1 hypothetical protein [Cytophagales bacterium]HAP58450.1 hypothetical protein [Cytophagales bacterium]
MKLNFVILFGLFISAASYGQHYQLEVAPKISTRGNAFLFQKDHGIFLYTHHSPIKRISGYVEMITEDSITVRRPIFHDQVTVALSDVRTVGNRTQWLTVFRYVGAVPLGIGSGLILAGATLMVLADSNNPDLAWYAGYVTFYHGVLLTPSIIPFLIPRRRFTQAKYDFRIVPLE